MNYSGEGIMSQINSLVAPPQTGSSSGGGKKDSSGYKKSGRSHKEICVACGDGGDMLSCDRCSTTMHSLCSDPPIDEEETRPNKWTCRSCRYAVSCLILPNENLTKGGKKKVGKKKAETQSPVLPTPDPVKKAMVAPDCKDPNTPIKNIFNCLMPEMRKLNPMEFSLPSDFPTYDHQFPGSSRQLYKKSASAKPKPLVIEEPDIGTSLKKKVFCFHCSQSCRLKALIKCDFCSAYYHFDCLNPPLITAPVGIWQCPLHVEPFLESATLETTKLTDRVRLWEKVNEPINTTSVISKFFRKAYNPNPPFHHKVEINRNKTAEVPEYVVGMYENNLCSSDDESLVDDDPPMAKKIKYSEDVLHKKFIQNSVEVSCEALDTVRNLKTKISSLDMLAKMAEELAICEKAVEELDLKTLKQLATRELLNQRWEEKLKSEPDLPTVPKKMTTNETLEKPLLHTTYTRMRPVLSLVCINSMKKITIRSRSVSIGMGGGVTVDLSKMASCRGVSFRHATISYDSLQCRWELVNYSPNGTIVDDCFLGCDFTPELREPNKFADSSEYSLKKYLMDRNKTALKLHSKGDAISLLQNCKCLQSAIPSLRTWEGPIPLKAKSRIKIGCVGLLVTTTDYVEDEVKSPMFKPYTVERHEKKVKLENALKQCLPPRPDEDSSPQSTKLAASPSKVELTASKSGKAFYNSFDKTLSSEYKKSITQADLPVAKVVLKRKYASKEKYLETKKELPKDKSTETGKNISKEKPLMKSKPDMSKDKQVAEKEILKEETVAAKIVSQKEKGVEKDASGAKETSSKVKKISQKEKSPETKKDVPIATTVTKDGSASEKINLNTNKASKPKDMPEKSKPKLGNALKVKRRIVVSAEALVHPYAHRRLIPPVKKLVPAKLSPKKLVNYFDTAKKTESAVEIKVTPPEPDVPVAAKSVKEISEPAPEQPKPDTTKDEAVKVVSPPQGAVKQTPKLVTFSKSPGTTASTSALPTTPTKTSPSIATKFGPVFKP